MARRSRNQTTTLTASTRSAAEIQAFYEQCAKEIADAESRRNSAFANDIAALFNAFPALNTIVLRGYTPGFNDGDPCYHHTCEPIVNGMDAEEGYEEGDVEEGGLSVADMETICGILSWMEASVTALYDTNYEVTVSRTPNGVTLSHDYYSCGY